MLRKSRKTPSIAFPLWELFGIVILLFGLIVTTTKAASNKSTGRWIGLGMKGATVGSIAISPNFVSDRTLFINTNEGIFKSTNAGNNWKKLFTGLPSWEPSSFDGYRSSIAISPNYQIDNTIIVNTSNSVDGSVNGIYRSQDKGEHWELVNIETGDFMGEQIAFSPDYKNDHTIFIGGYGFLAKSSNSGASWQMTSPFPNRIINDFAFSPNYDTDQTIFAAVTEGGDTSNTGGVLKSTDRGTTWNLITPFDQQNINPWSVVVSPNFATDHTVFAGTDALDGKSTVIKSIDGGETWYSANTGLPTTDIQDMIISPNGIVYAGAGGGGAFISYNFGKSWEPLDYMPDSTCENFYSLAVSPQYITDNTIYAGCNSRDFVNMSGVWKHVLSGQKGPNKDFDLLSPFNNGVTWTVISGYYNNRNQSETGCHIGLGPDHCRNQLFGLDIVPDQQNDTEILAPGNGKVSYRGKLEGGCIGLRITLDNGLNLNVCHFAAWNVGPSDRVLRGKVLGTRSTSHVHLSLDDRYRIGTLCPGQDRCYLPIPFDSQHTIEGMSLNPDPNGETVTLPYPLCDQRNVSCQFKVGFRQYQNTFGTSTNIALQ